MKFRLVALSIIISTALIILTINSLLNKTTTNDQTYSSIETPLLKPKNKFPTPSFVSEKTTEKLPTIIEDELDDDDDIDTIPKDKTNNHESLSAEDIKKINTIASLSDADLRKEMDSLMAKIQEEDLFHQLEEGGLSKEKEAKAKETLEKFALLGLEKTRRKYMEIEPELKDAVYAHRESLKEIREFLNDDE